MCVITVEEVPGEQGRECRVSLYILEKVDLAGLSTWSHGRGE